MKQRKPLTRFLAVVLCLSMALGLLPITAIAYDPNYQSETHTVFRHTEQTLAPGVEYYNNYAYYTDGEQVVYYVAVADINRDDVLIQGSYWNMQTEQYGMAKLTEQVASANAKFTNPDDPDFISENYTVVAGTNGDFYNMQTGRPSGAFAINGHVMNEANNRPWFAVFEDGTALCGANNTDYAAAIEAHGPVMNSVGGSQLLVKDGVDVTASASGSYNTDRHSRTMIGVTADNKVVCAVVDGRQSPFSDGGCMHELAQIMLEAECVVAINLDGGGSTTFGARPEGEDDFKVINRPSDGSERSISSGVIIASLAAPSNVFDRAAITVENDYVTPYSEVGFSVVGVSSSGASAEVPAEVTYEATLGSVVNGKFVSDGTVGDAEIKAVYNGAVVGTAVVHVVLPDTIAFAQDTFTIPYGKTVDLGIVAKYGLNVVTTKPADFNYTLAIASGAGEVVNGSFVGPDESSGAAGNTVTATLVYDNTKATTANIIFGKGSVVLYDFEDGTIQNWVRYQKANYNYLYTLGTTSNITAENGQVHNGDHALKVEMKWSDHWEAGYVGCFVGYSGSDYIDLKGATRLGMWVYLPIENKSLNGRIFLSKVSERDEETGAILGASGVVTATKIDQGGDWNCGFVTQYEEPGWHYIYFDLSPDIDYCISPKSAVLDIYLNDRNGDAYGYNHLDYKSQNADMVIYIDDVTVDYSSVVEDRDAPVFSSVLLGDRGPHSNEALTLTNGYVSEGYSQLSFSARVADYAANNATGLNGATAKCWIDGNEVPCTFNTGLISAEEYDFADGQHTVKFGICDNQGNYKSTMRTFTVAAENNRPTVKIVPHDETLDRILLGSVYYVDVVATNAELVDHISIDLDLNNLSVWELDHMQPAEGVEASWTMVNEDEKIARVEITKTAECTAQGESALVSIPTRTWELRARAANYGHAGVVWMYPQYRKGNEVWPVDVEVKVARGAVSFTDGNTDFFTGEKVRVDTESIYWDNDNAKASDPYYINWNGGHDHRPETAQYYADGTTNHTTEGQVVYVEGFEPKAATCTEDGFTGRTFCTVCNSVVDWGEVIPATGHDFVVDTEAGVIKCSVCGEQDTYTGLVDVDGVNYFSKFGVLVSGWYEIDGEWYYFVPETKAAANGTVKTTDKVTFEFDNGKVLDGVWVTGSSGIIRYWYGPSYYKITSKNVPYLVQEIHGKIYLFAANGAMQTGIKANHRSNETIKIWYDCGTDGAATKLAGPMLLDYEGKTYYVDENGESPAVGLVLLDGDYYYVIYDGSIKKDGDRYVSEEMANGLMPAGTYHFGPDGKMVLPEPPEVLNGIYDDFYYENGVIVKDKGLVLFEGDYYYVIYNGKIKKDGDRVVTEEKANGLMPAGKYHFGPNGKMVLPEQPEPRTGVYDGFYYEDGVIVKDKGLVLFEGDYYYVIYNGKIKKDGDRVVTEEKANGLLPAGKYHFGPDGKMEYRVN